jgi:hypothetical protein
MVAVKNGRVLWIEVKTEKGKLSAEQGEFQKNIEEHGGKYVIARGVEDIEL